MSKFEYGVKVDRLRGKSYVNLGDGKTAIITGDFCYDNLVTRKFVSFGYVGEQPKVEDATGMKEEDFNLKSFITFESDEGIDNLIMCLESLKDE